jgi:hypothetical protein
MHAYTHDSRGAACISQQQQLLHGWRFVVGASSVSCLDAVAGYAYLSHVLPLALLCCAVLCCLDCCFCCCSFVLRRLNPPAETQVWV